MPQKRLPIRESFVTRLFLSHIMVAVLTGIGTTAVGFLIIRSAMQSPTLEVYQVAAYNYGMMWLAGFPSGGETDPEIDPMPGWTLIVSQNERVIWSRGDTRCTAGMAAADCETFEALPTENHFFDKDGHRWADITVPLVTGHRVLMRRGEITTEPYLFIGNVFIRGYSNLMMLEILSRGVMAIPIALVLAWVMMRPLIRRILAITDASRRFARGDLEARIHDVHTDDVGRLAQQFDDMAAALSLHVQTLHELAQRNASLALAAEEAAIKAERSRMSRELHDAIAQRLFSLCVSTTTLPDVIAQNPERGIQQSRSVAEMAEKTLLDLRGLLLELRPADVVQHGLSESLKHLFAQWKTLHHIEIEASLMLTGQHIPSAVEDAVYQIAQEALSNIVRHASASLVEVALVEGQQRLVLSISDNGCGFDVETHRSQAQYGLMSMRERAHMFGGTLHIESEANRGTTIEVLLPLAREK